MDRRAVAQALDVDEAWLDGWKGEAIGIYPASMADEAGSGKYERVSRSAEGPGMWVIDIGVRSMFVTATEASRVRYTLDRLHVPNRGRAPDGTRTKTDAG